MGYIYLMDLKKVIISVLVLAAVFAAGKYSGPREKTITKKVEKVAAVAKEEKKNVATTTKEYLAKCDPSSSTVPVKETHQVDLSQINTNSFFQQKTLEQTVIKNKPQWLYSLGVGIDTYSKAPVYSGELNTRLFDTSSFIGVQGLGNTKNQNILLKWTGEL